MSRADVIAGVLAEHRWQSTAIRLGPAMECGCGEWVDNHEAHVAAVLAAAEPAAEQARAGALTEAEDVFDRARSERARAHEKHGERSMESVPWHDPTGRRMRVLVEGVGEVAKELNDAEVEGRPVDGARLAAELIQVAAMAGAWADAALAGDAEHERSGT